MNFIKSNFGNFNFAKFKGPRIESAVPKDPGINYVWYWNEEKKMYLYPEEGVKRYRAVRRTVMAGKKIKQSAFFENLDQARAWRFNQETPHYPVVRNGADIFSVGLNLADVGPTFEEVVLMWKKAKWKMFTLSTQLFYDCKLSYLKFFEGMYVRAITPQVVDQWLAHMTDIKVTRQQHSTRRAYFHELELLSGIFRYYDEYKDDLKFVFPVKKRHREAAIVRHERIKIKKPMTPEQFEMWCNSLRTQKHGLMKATLARLQRSGALRISEAAAVHWKDIDWNRRCVNIHRSVMWPRKKGMNTFIQEGFKNGDEKTIPLSPDAFKALDELRKSKTCEFVFHKDGAPLEYRFIQHAYDFASKATDSDIRGTHVMRRTGASWILNETGDIDLAKQLLGNSTWSSVKPYAQRESKAVSNYNEKLWEIAEAEDENQISNSSKKADLAR